MYSDDTVLLSPSASGLQHLIQICEAFAIDCDIVFNHKKYVYMCLHPKGFSLPIVPKINLNDAYIKLVSDHKYLGIQMCNSNSDDNEMSKQ